MFLIDTEQLQINIRKQFDLNCSISLNSDPDTRFSLLMNFEGFILRVSATEARVSVILPINEFHETLRMALLAQTELIRPKIEADIQPFFLAIWKNSSKMYHSVPNAKKLKENKELLFEIYSGPQEVSEKERAFDAVERVVFKTVSLIVTMKNTNGKKEGQRAQYLVSKVERSSKNRDLCVALFGYDCQICKEDLTTKYGDLAEDFIHVHHIESIAATGEKWINPYTDLIPVCPNCHSMLHRKNPPLHPDELIEILKKNEGEAI